MKLDEDGIASLLALVLNKVGREVEITFDEVEDGLEGLVIKIEPDDEAETISIKLVPAEEADTNGS